MNSNGFIDWALLEIENATSLDAAKAFAKAAVKLRLLTTQRRIRLLSRPTEFVPVIKILRDHSPSLSLKEAKDLVESAPGVVFTGSEVQAAKLATALQEKGAKFEIDIVEAA